MDCSYANHAHRWFINLFNCSQRLRKERQWISLSLHISAFTVFTHICFNWSNGAVKSASNQCHWDEKGASLDFSEKALKPLSCRVKPLSSWAACWWGFGSHPSWPNYIKMGQFHLGNSSEIHSSYNGKGLHNFHLSLTWYWQMSRCVMWKLQKNHERASLVHIKKASFAVPSSIINLWVNRVPTENELWEWTRHTSQTCWNLWNCVTIFGFIVIYIIDIKTSDYGVLLNHLVDWISLSFHDYSEFANRNPPVLFDARRWSDNTDWISSWRKYNRKCSSGCIPNTDMSYVKSICNW